VAAQLDAEVIVNLQGDEPLIEASSIVKLIDLMQAPNTDMATLAVPIKSIDDYRNPNVVKVVSDDAGRALYFSRSPIPYFRDGEPLLSQVRQHLGLYAYRREFLRELTQQPPHPLELAEKLEQLRVLGMGRTLRVGTVPMAHRGVDTPEDYAAFVASWNGINRAA
jgi:3-deoxy-manno-octulosonate cytidylyltransferase (CMP-KDO synthetase)